MTNSLAAAFKPSSVGGTSYPMAIVSGRTQLITGYTYTQTSGGTAVLTEEGTTSALPRPFQDDELEEGDGPLTSDSSARLWSGGVLLGPDRVPVGKSLHGSMRWPDGACSS